MTGTEATDTSDATEQRPRWSLATLIAFRFGTCYFGSFGLALVIGLIPVILAGIGIDGPWSATRGLTDSRDAPADRVDRHAPAWAACGKHPARQRQRISVDGALLHRGRVGMGNAGLDSA